MTRKITRPNLNKQTLYGIISALKYKLWVLDPTMYVNAYMKLYALNVNESML